MINHREKRREREFGLFHGNKLTFKLKPLIKKIERFSPSVKGYVSMAMMIKGDRNALVGVIRFSLKNISSSLSHSLST